MSNNLKEAFEQLEKEKNISAEVLFNAIEASILNACRSNYGRSDNVRVEFDQDTFAHTILAKKIVVETKDDVMDPATEVALEDAIKSVSNAQVGDEVEVKLDSKDFGRIATQAAKNVMLQKIREEERNAVYDYFTEKQKTIVTGTVQRYMGKNISINIGKADGILNEKEQVPGEKLYPSDRVKVYILEVKNTQKGPRIFVSRTHVELVKQLFEEVVTEIGDGLVEIKSIAREPGNRTKIAVYAEDPSIDAVGACVGMNGVRVNSIVDELKGEKIDIVNWDENPGNFIQNALAPARITMVFADPEDLTAKVVVPDDQLSLAIGKEGQNARLAVKLTGYKIDIKDETTAKDTPGFRYEDYFDDEDDEDEEYEEDLDDESIEDDDTEFSEDEINEYEDKEDSDEDANDEENDSDEDVNDGENE